MDMTVPRDAEPSTKLWNCKYVGEWDKHDFFHFFKERGDFHTSNSSQKGRNLIKENIFWEIRDEELTSFWDDP